MRDEQINTSIAEACGWTDIHDSGGWHQHKLWGYPPLKEGQKWRFFDPIPDYCNDLNAMHVAEKMLGDPAIRREYVYLLGRIVNACGRFDAIHATARQRAEAFLRTLGKWEE